MNAGRRTWQAPVHDSDIRDAEKRYGHAYRDGGFSPAKLPGQLLFANLHGLCTHHLVHHLATLQPPKQNLDEAVLLRLAQWELATFRRVSPELIVIGEANDPGATQTMVDEVDEIDENVATAEDL